MQDEPVNRSQGSLIRAIKRGLCVGLGVERCAGTQCGSSNTCRENKEGQGRLHKGGNSYLERMLKKVLVPKPRERRRASRQWETMCKTKGLKWGLIRTHAALSKAGP